MAAGAAPAGSWLARGGGGVGAGGLRGGAGLGLHGQNTPVSIHGRHALAPLQRSQRTTCRLREPQAGAGLVALVVRRMLDASVGAVDAW